MLQRKLLKTCQNKFEAGTNDLKKLKKKNSRSTFYILQVIAYKQQPLPQLARANTWSPTMTSGSNFLNLARKQDIACFSEGNSTICTFGLIDGSRHDVPGLTEAMTPKNHNQTLFHETPIKNHKYLQYEFRGKAHYKQFCHV